MDELTKELLAALEWAMRDGDITYHFRTKTNAARCDKIDEVRALIEKAKQAGAAA